jgi:hypothetical protein
MRACIHTACALMTMVVIVYTSRGTMPPPRRIEAPCLVNGGHGASLRHHNTSRVTMPPPQATRRCSTRWRTSARAVSRRSSYRRPTPGAAAAAATAPGAACGLSISRLMSR